MVGQRVLRLETFDIRERVPPPFAHGAKRHAAGINVREGLQARGIDGKGKLSVSHRQG